MEKGLFSLHLFLLEDTSDESRQKKKKRNECVYMRWLIRRPEGEQAPRERRKLFLGKKKKMSNEKLKRKKSKEINRKAKRKQTREPDGMAESSSNSSSRRTTDALSSLNARLLC
jgi:hypothetical protein